MDLRLAWGVMDCGEFLLFINFVSFCGASIVCDVLCVFPLPRCVVWPRGVGASLHEVSLDVFGALVDSPSLVTV